MATLYGLRNCDTCRKAQNWLKRFGIGHAFVDYRDERQPQDVDTSVRIRNRGAFQLDFIKKL